MQLRAEAVRCAALPACFSSRWACSRDTAGQANPGSRAWRSRPTASRRSRAVADGCCASELKAGNEILVFGQPKGVTYCWSLGISPDGKRLIVGGDNGKAQFSTCRPASSCGKLVGHTKAIWGVALLADGKRAVTGAWDQSIRVWDVDTGKKSPSLQGVHDNCRYLAIRRTASWWPPAILPWTRPTSDTCNLGPETGTQIRDSRAAQWNHQRRLFPGRQNHCHLPSYNKSVRTVGHGQPAAALKSLAGHTQSRGKRRPSRRTANAWRELRRCRRPDTTIWNAASGSNSWCRTPAWLRGFLCAGVLPKKTASCNGWQGRA